MRSFDTLDLIYDTQRTSCVRGLSIVRRLDVFGVPRFYDAHDPETLKKRFPLLRRVDGSIYTILEVGGSNVGSSFRRLVRSSPLTWLLVPLFYFPGSNFFGPRVYAGVARNRARFGRQPDVCGVGERTLAGRYQEKKARAVSL